jgi:hypothetical protein
MYPQLTVARFVDMEISWNRPFPIAIFWSTTGGLEDVKSALEMYD